MIVLKGYTLAESASHKMGYFVVYMNNKRIAYNFRNNIDSKSEVLNIRNYEQTENFQRFFFFNEGYGKISK